MEPATKGVPVNLSSWVENAKPTLKPPVGNRMMYDGAQFQIMIIGGPNQRDDFHVEKGEELFVQLEGDMNLDVMQEGKRVAIPIKEMDLFVLPLMVPHSPQRYENTIGLVIERVRTPKEMDTLRWYKKGTNKIDYEETFHCDDLGTQIKEVILRYFGMKDAGKVEGEFGEADAEPKIHTPDPAPLSQILENAPAGGITSFLKSEFTVSIAKGCVQSPLPDANGGDYFLWQLKGSSMVGSQGMTENEVMLLPTMPGAPVSLDQSEGSLLLIVTNHALV